MELITYILFLASYTCQTVSLGILIESNLNLAFCTCNSDCHSSFCNPYNQHCQDAALKQFLPPCNHSSLVCGEPSANRCGAIICDCDNQCTGGTFCDKYCQVKGDRMLSGWGQSQRHGGACLNPWLYAPGQVNYDSPQSKCRQCRITNRYWEGRNTCWDETPGIRFVTLRSQGPPLNYCQVNDTLTLLCENRETTCFYNYTTNQKSVTRTLNKCTGVRCLCDHECLSNYCQQGVCALQVERQCNESSGRRCLSEGVYSGYMGNLCDGVGCRWDGECQSGYCDQVCLERGKRVCNGSEMAIVGRDQEDGTYKSANASNRCQGVKCEMDGECQSGYCKIFQQCLKIIHTFLCKENSCQSCNFYPFNSDNLCPNQLCESNSQCATNICFNTTCASLTDCNPTNTTSNRCLSTPCTLSSDCQPFALCLNSICALPSIPAIQQSSKSTLIITIASVASVLATAFVVIMLRYYRLIRLKRRVPVAKKNHINLTTENNAINKGNAVDETVKTIIYIIIIKQLQ